jgi:hypothetical protein
LAPALLWDAELYAVLNLRVDAVAMATVALAEDASFVLDGGEVLTACRAAETEDVFDDEDPRLKVVHMAKEFTEKVATWVVLQPTRSVIRAIKLASGAKTLAGRATDDDVDRASANYSGEFVG